MTDHLTRGADVLARHPGFRLVGRDDVLSRLIAILTRRHASSAILTGPSGVGCSAITLGVQAAKADPGAPFDLVRKRLLFLDVDSMFSNGGNLTEVTSHLLARLKRTKDSVLIVEDTRDLIEACRANGTTGLINGLLAAVQNGDTQAILEVKDEDLDAVLKHHSDLRELFTVLPVEEPTGEALAQIVRAASTGLVKHHGIEVGEEPIEAAIEATTRFPTRALNRAQPDKTITLLDRALATYRLEAHRQPPGWTTEAWAERQATIRRINEERRQGEEMVAEAEDRLAEAHDRQERARQNGTTPAAFAGVDTNEVGDLRARISFASTEVDKLNLRLEEMVAEVNAGLSLDRATVQREFSKISGIAVDKMNEDEIARLRDLAEVLKRRVYGQDAGIDRIANGVKVARVGRRARGVPTAFLILGPSGVGKTETAKALAQALFGDEQNLGRFDMSEYMEKHAVAKLIGAPPGYEGFEVGGILTNLMRRGSNRVLLFDEIEKAHPEVFDVFLQVLSDGRLTDNVGRSVTFDQTVIIMTTNVGTPHFLDPELSDEAAAEAAVAELSNQYRTEFLNRFNGRQNILCYQKLTTEVIEKIVRREITSIDQTYSERKVRVRCDDEVIIALTRDRYDPRVGARGLPGFITASLEPMIVDHVLADRTGEMVVGWESGRFTLTSKREEIQT